MASNCDSCIWHLGDGTCAAFPDGIPMAILSGTIDHEQPVPGDGGLAYLEAPLSAWTGEAGAYAGDGYMVAGRGDAGEPVDIDVPDEDDDDDAWVRFAGAVKKAKLSPVQREHVAHLFRLRVAYLAAELGEDGEKRGSHWLRQPRVPAGNPTGGQWSQGIAPVGGGGAIFMPLDSGMQAYPANLQTPLGSERRPGQAVPTPHDQPKPATTATGDGAAPGPDDAPGLVPRPAIAPAPLKAPGGAPAAASAAVAPTSQPPVPAAPSLAPDPTATPQAKITAKQDKFAPQALKMHGSIDMTYPGLISEAAAKTHSRLRPKSPPMSEQQLDAITTYTGASYTLINGNLRGEKQSFAESAQAQQLISRIDAGMKHAKVGQDTYVMRGLGRTVTEKLRTANVGMVLHESGYGSSSTKFQVARDFSKTFSDDDGYRVYPVMQIKVPKGLRALSVQSISNVASEDEILLPRRTKMRLDGTSRKIVDGEHIQIFHMTVVEQGPP